MKHFLITNFTKPITNSLIKQGQKNLITAAMTGIASILSSLVGYGGVALTKNQAIFYQISLLASAVLIPVSILIANLIWDRTRLGWLRSNDLFRQRKFLEDRYLNDLKMLNSLPISEVDKIKESKKIYRDYKRREKSLDARYLPPASGSVHSLPG